MKKFIVISLILVLAGCVRVPHIPLPRAVSVPKVPSIPKVGPLLPKTVPARSPFSSLKPARTLSGASEASPMTREILPAATKKFPKRKTADPSGVKEGTPHLHIPHFRVHKSEEERKDQPR